MHREANIDKFNVNNGIFLVMISIFNYYKQVVNF